MTVYIRVGDDRLPDELTPKVPTLARLTQMLDGRPYWLARFPLEVDRETFDAAEQEMQETLKARGYKEIQRADIPQYNFLLFGAPVIVARTDG